MQARNLLWAVLLLSASVAEGTQFQAFSRSAQVHGSDLILIGRVIEVRSDWNASGEGIHTDAEIAIDEVWKGSPREDHVVVRTPGGAVGDVEYELDGSAKFRASETVLLFLTRDGDVYRPWGMIFGKYAVEGNRGFLIGNLPPAVSGAQQFEAVSIDVADLRDEVQSILSGASQ